MTTWTAPSAQSHWSWGSLDRCSGTAGGSRTDVPTRRGLAAPTSPLAGRHEVPRLCLQRPLHQRDVHPAVEFVCGVADGAYRFEAQLLVKLQARAVVGGHGGDDRPVAESARLRDQLGQECPPDPPTVVHRVDVDEVLDDVDAPLLPGKQARPADD